MISGEWCEHASKNLQTKLGESEYTDLHKAQDACAANQGSCFDQVVTQNSQIYRMLDYKSFIKHYRGRVSVLSRF